MILKGQKVKWISQAKGVEKEKSGTVIGIIQPGKRALTLVPKNTPQSRIKFQNISCYERALMEVPSGKDGKTKLYYCPLTSVLINQGN